MNGGYRIDLREVVDYDDVDKVKLLANGQVRNTLEVITDYCSEEARSLIEGEDGRILSTEESHEQIGGKKMKDDEPEKEGSDTVPERRSIEVEINEESLSGQIELAAEELNLSEEERQEFERRLYEIVESREEENNVVLTDNAKKQMVNILASVWRQEYPQIEDSEEEG